MSIQKTVIQVTVYHPDYVSLENMSLQTIAYEMDEGDSIGCLELVSTEVPEKMDVIKALEEMGSEASFFYEDDEDQES